MQYLASDLTVFVGSLIFIGFLTETVVEIVKEYFVGSDKSDKFKYTLSIVVGLVLAFAMKVSIFAEANIFAYYIGVVISGLVASRGSNFIHDWAKSLPIKK